MDFFSTFLVSLAAIVAVIVGVVVLAYVLARNNVFFTIVESGWCRIVLTWGEYSGKVGPGLRWIGIPGINTLYKRKMTFLKSVTDKDGKPVAEPHEDEDISSFKTTDYAYAFPFKDEEDSHALPLTGMLAVIAVIADYHKAFFEASDWYAIMNTEIMPCFRDTLAQISYDEDIVGRDTAEEQARKTFSERLWEAMNQRKGGNPSVIEKLFNLYGIQIKSAELRSVDPPEGWRATTLAPYKAMKEREAAVHQAQTSATLLDDTNQALKTWSATHPTATQAQIMEKQRELRARALAKTGSYQELDIKGLEGATTAVVGGGGAGAGVLLGGQQGKGGGKKKKAQEMDHDDLVEWMKNRKKGP